MASMALTIVYVRIFSYFSDLPTSVVLR